MALSLLHLPERSIFQLTGSDRYAFLQSALSCHVSPAEEMRLSIYGFLLSPQGKISCDIHIIPHKDATLLDIGTADIPSVINALKMAAIGRNVTLEAAPSLEVHAVYGSDEILSSDYSKDEQTNKNYPFPTASPSVVEHVADGLLISDSRDNRIGARFYGRNEHAMAFAQASGAHIAQSADIYHATRIYCGVWDASYDLPPAGLFPLDIGAELYGAVSVRKGCYIGQEVTSRMYHKGARRKRRAVISCAPDASFRHTDEPAKLRDEHHISAGFICSSSGNAALACLKYSDKMDMKLSCEYPDGTVLSPLAVRTIFHPVS